MLSLRNCRVGVVGLGYVGLPLAIEFGKHFVTIGFDVKRERIRELRAARDSTLEIEDVPLVVFCEQCETERRPRAGTGLICPECGNACPNIVSGRELQLVAVEVPE